MTALERKLDFLSLAGQRPSNLNARGLIVDDRSSIQAVARDAPTRSKKSIAAAVEIAAARRLNLLGLDAYMRGGIAAQPRPTAVRGGSRA